MLDRSRRRLQFVCRAQHSCRT